MTGDGLVGRIFAHYRIEEKLAKGGMGEVYRAYDTVLQRQVAIKVLPPQEDTVPDKRDRFLQEARSASALNHPHIITIHEVGREGDLDYIVMEFIAGKTLHDLIHSTGLTLSETLRYAVQTADAIAAAHEAGIIHRDLKPSNIMIGKRGSVKVVDFGIAKRAPSDSPEITLTLQAQTQKGLVLGTVPYMSPEQAEGKQVDPRSDIFSFGAILYEMVTGRRAFQRDSIVSTLVAVVKEDPPPVNMAGSDPNELDRIIWRCLRKDPAQRIQSAGDLRIALEEIQHAWETAHIIPQLASHGVPVEASAERAAVAALVAPVVAPMVASATAGMLSTGPRTAAAAVTVTVAPAGKRWLRPLAGGLLLAAAAAGGWFLYSTRRPAPLPPPVITRLTSDSGLTGWPVLSRDGKLVAYASDRGEDNNLHIWVQQAGARQAIKLTKSAADDYEPAFSPDGTRIAFHSEAAGGGVYIVSTLGGEPRLLAPNGRRPRFSPDGSRIVYWTGGDFGQIFVVDANGGTPKALQSEFTTARYPVWSPDGKFILFQGYRSESNQNDWWAAPVQGGAPVATGVAPQLTAHHIRMSSGFGDLSPATWLPDRHILFSGSSGDAINLWRIAISPRSMKVSGPPERITTGASMEMQPDAMLDGQGITRAVFASLTQKIDIWSLKVDANRGTVKGDLERITHGTTEATQVTMSADGNRIAYLGDLYGKPNVWIKDLRSGRETELASGLVGYAPMISPDGSTLYWSTYGQGKLSRSHRAAIAPDGQLGIPEILCENCGWVANRTPDGHGVLYGTDGMVGARDLRTNQSYDLLTHPQYRVWGGRFSPDGRWVLFNATLGVHSQVFMAPFDAEARRTIAPGQWMAVTDGKTWDDKPRWSPDGRSVYFISQRDGFRCIWRQTLSARTNAPSGEAAAVYHFHRARLSMMNVNIGPLSIAVSEGRLVFSLCDLTGDAWMATFEPR